LETIISSSIGNCSSIFEFTFIRGLSFREPEKHVEKKRVQNQKGDDVTKENIIDSKSLHLDHYQNIQW